MANLCACGCKKPVGFVMKGDKTRGYKAGEPRKYASHSCYLNHREATRITDCSICGSKKVKSGRSWRCKTCSRARLRAKKYGITFEQALAVPDSCEACGVESESLNVDHDHLTGKFRGWLCHSCNMALGQVNDSPERLRDLIIYLRTHPLGRCQGTQR